MGASDFSKLPHIGESLKRKEDVRFLTGVGNYTDDVNQANQKYAVFVQAGEITVKVISEKDLLVLQWLQMFQDPFPFDRYQDGR